MLVKYHIYQVKYYYIILYYNEERIISQSNITRLTKGLLFYPIGPGRVFDTNFKVQFLLKF